MKPKMMEKLEAMNSVLLKMDYIQPVAVEEKSKKHKDVGIAKFLQYAKCLKGAEA